MARLHEHQGKALLRAGGIAVPEGRVVASSGQARAAAAALGGRVVLKAQAWVTSRAAAGGVKFADTPEQAERAATDMLALRFGHFPVEEVLVERAIDIANEIFVSLTIDDRARAPVLLLDARGGSGIEDRAGSVRTIAIDAEGAVDAAAVKAALRGSPIEPRRHDDLTAAIAALCRLARRHEARSLEVNPLVVTRDGRVVAADCRITIDDYAVFRHTDLNIEIARELDHPATKLERIAYRVEQADHRGTFYFAQLPSYFAQGPASQPPDGSGRPLIGFHGAGGGGSMMSMDAISRQGFAPANFCDTSGNPSASKVYRAARIILAQPGLVGYFGSGSGVASQEQEHSARGLAKAFCELNLDIPAVIRLGGNGEDRAVEILQGACRGLPGKVEGYRKDDSPASIAKRFAELVEASRKKTWVPRTRRVPKFVGTAYSFAIDGGTVWIDHERCDAATTAFLIDRGAGMIVAGGPHGKAILAVEPGAFASKDSELVALEIECRLRAAGGEPVLFVDLPIAELD